MLRSLEADTCRRALVLLPRAPAFLQEGSSAHRPAWHLPLRPTHHSATAAGSIAASAVAADAHTSRAGSRCTGPDVCHRGHPVKDLDSVTGSGHHRLDDHLPKYLLLLPR